MTIQAAGGGAERGKAALAACVAAWWVVAPEVVEAALRVGVLARARAARMEDAAEGEETVGGVEAVVSTSSVLRRAPYRAYRSLCCRGRLHTRRRKRRGSSRLSPESS